MAETLILPRLVYAATTPVGAIRCVLRESTTVDATADGKVRISPRVEENVYRLTTQERVVITTRSKVARPPEIDGILQRGLDDRLRWISHKLIDAIEQAAEQSNWRSVLDGRAATWRGQFSFRQEKQNADGSVNPGNEGLRPPQIGALHAIGAHWSLSYQPATIVMPTGTGKTETMLSSLALYDRNRILVIVPTDALRNQTIGKFLTLGKLRALGALAPAAGNPIVGMMTKRPKALEDLALFERCNVVVSTMAALRANTNSATADESDDETSQAEDEREPGVHAESFDLAAEIAKRVDALFVDEAHHVPAASWSSFREAFTDKPVIQFTATPFRRDGRLVDGTVIYNYPLRRAQQDNYFKPITFEPVYEPAPEHGDEAIAALALKTLRRDKAARLSHVMMARCRNVARARSVFGLYQRLAPDLHPVLIHSDLPNAAALVEDLRHGKYGIAVCVNMLGEGFDLPELKIAAIHDLHKSLAVLLQFTGRFTRSAGKSIGDATLIANIAEPGVPAALERLYSEDADWNHLLSEMSSDAAKDHARLVKFLQEAKPITGDEEDRDSAISRQLLRPTLSTLVFEADNFRPKTFFEGLPTNLTVERAWLHTQSDTLFFVTRTEPYLKWTRAKSVRDRQWALFVLHFDKKRKLLYLSSSDKSSEFRTLAEAVGAGKLLSGEVIFRSLGHIARLLFQNIGLKKHGRRNLSYAMYTGAQVAEALGLTETAGASKSNLSGIGWEEGKQVSIGCSAKGRVWSREQGSIPRLNEWCESIGDKLLDPSINMKDLLANVLIPTEVTTLPDVEILSVEWPLEMLREAEERIIFRQDTREGNSFTFDLAVVGVDRSAAAIDFELIEARAGRWATFRFALGGPNAFAVEQISGSTVVVKVGGLAAQPLAALFSEWPPLFRFVDLTELDANLHIAPKDPQELRIADACFETWDWGGIDLKKESMWKDGVYRPNSIQERTAEFFINGGFDIVFDDDAAREAADLVCIKAENDCIRVLFVHCKFAGGKTAGERVKDVVEVSSQAVRSAKWNARFVNLAQHLKKREEALRIPTRPTRFLAGSATELNQLVKSSRLMAARSEILIVQPGLSKSGHTADQRQVLAAAHTYLKQTIDVDLKIVCSA